LTAADDIVREGLAILTQSLSELQQESVERSAAIA